MPARPLLKQLAACNALLPSTPGSLILTEGPTGSFAEPLKGDINSTSETLLGQYWVNLYKGFWLFRWVIYLEPRCFDLSSLHESDCVLLLLIAL